MRGSAGTHSSRRFVSWLSGASLSADETSDAFDVIMTGEATPAQIGALLMDWQ